MSLHSLVISSVARGGRGGSSPPHWLVKYAKSHVFCALRPIFCEKWKIAPPIRKEPPLKRLNLRNWKKNHSEFCRRPFFFFWRSPNFGRKKPLNSGFRPKNHSKFWRRPFFFIFLFWRSPNFGRKKPLNFRAFRDISSQFSDKPSETDSRSMKIRVKVVCTLLTLSK